jgi:hypothetical protein
MEKDEPAQLGWQIFCFCFNDFHACVLKTGRHAS